MNEPQNKAEIPSTDILKHKKIGTILKPPLRQIETTPASWRDERLPEMLWAVLLIGNLRRDEALEIFRRVGFFVRNRGELSDITHSGISSWKKEDRSAFIALLKGLHPNADKILQSLVIFTKLPNRDDWREHFGEPKKEKEEEFLNYLLNGVASTLWHQSQEATDCRWVKVLCQIEGGKVKFSSSMPDISDTLRGIFEYPNYGDLRHIRPFIRALEIAQNPLSEKGSSKWSKDFWNACLSSTLCNPLLRDKQQNDKIKISNDQINRIRHLLLLHYLTTDKSTAIEAKHDTIFGFGFYTLRLLDELVKTNLSRGAVGRITLRTCVECYITLAYQVTKDDPIIWSSFRDYGIGQMKLSYLKTRDAKNKPTFIDEAFLEKITNEDRWEEFSDIELSHWASSDLRKLSDEAKCKDIYDAYYGWTSNFAHGNWGAIRESCVEMCANPLHRCHLIPVVSVYPLPGVLEDMVKIINLILDIINSQYPGFDVRINNEPEVKKISIFKSIYMRIRYHKEQKLLDRIIGGK